MLSSTWCQSLTGSSWRSSMIESVEGTMDTNGYWLARANSMPDMDIPLQLYIAS